MRLESRLLATLGKPYNTDLLEKLTSLLMPLMRLEEKVVSPACTEGVRGGQLSCFVERGNVSLIDFRWHPKGRLLDRRSVHRVGA